MSRQDFLNLLRENGHGVDKTGKGSLVTDYVVRMTPKEIERLTGNKNWKHTALGRYDAETGLFHFSVCKRERQ